MLFGIGIIDQSVFTMALDSGVTKKNREYVYIDKFSAGVPTDDL